MKVTARETAAGELRRHREDVESKNNVVEPRDIIASSAPIPPARS